VSVLSGCWYVCRTLIIMPSWPPRSLMEFCRCSIPITCLSRWTTLTSQSLTARQSSDLLSVRRCSYLCIFTMLFVNVSVVGMMLYRAMNYTRVFTEMGEALVETIVKTPNEVIAHSANTSSQYICVCLIWFFTCATLC